MIVLTYTMFGGLFSCAYTDIFQIYLAVIGFWAAFIYIATGHAGPSWDTMLNAVPGGYTDFTGMTDKDNGALINWAAILSLGSATWSRSTSWSASSPRGTAGPPPAARTGARP